MSEILDLMNKDKQIASVFIYKDQDGYEKLAYHSKYIQIPFWLENIDLWIRERIAVGRIHIGRICDAANIRDIESFIDVCNAASINDSLWIKKENASTTWEQVNLYKNEFNTVIADYALSGTGELNSNIINKLRSPEYTTLGSYDKCWKREGGDIVLWKKGLEKWSEASGNESFSEYYSSLIARDILGLKEYRDYIPYTVHRYDEKYYISKCKCFTTEDIGFIPMYLVCNTSFDIKEFLGIMESINKYSADLYRKMIVLDYITMNVDRHVGNFGCLIDNNTLEIKRMAPIFDNNLGLYPKLPILDKTMQDIISDLRLLTPKYETSFKSMLNVVINDNIRNTIKTWSGFKRTDGISLERIEVMNIITMSRLRNILK